jgi:DNA-directed RNA polymerase
MSHNSKYWNYYTTISITYLYLNVEFYIPTFMDFRGRIYPLINYLNYQGDDLNRSLLLFANEIEEITDTGLETLYSYFANLCGKSKESYADKME